MAEDRVPYGQIEWWVGHMHVSTKDEEIAEDLLGRLKKAGATDEEADLAVAHALFCHEENRGLYRAVTAGTF